MSEWFSGDPLNDYSTTQEKLWYLEARLKGDAAAVLFGLGEAEVGTGGLATTGITGVGAVVSGVAIAHGLSVAAKGTADIALTWQKIYKLNMAGSGGTSSDSHKPTNESNASSKTVRKERGKWVLTKEGASQIKSHKTFGTFYKSKSDGLWWSVDKAGHGGSKFKVFKETKEGLEWYKDADEFGDFIIGKHKGDIGKFISWKTLSTVK
ncbi:MAG: hypothetical protein KF862_08690 [Chitinophagaceae bacterium]|nr:hypothetical protein [Chitinophagaceae bacterium]